MGNAKSSRNKLRARCRLKTVPPPDSQSCRDARRQMAAQIALIPPFRRQSPSLGRSNGDQLVFLRVQTHIELPRVTTAASRERVSTTAELEVLLGVFEEDAPLPSRRKPRLCYTPLSIRFLAGICHL